MSAQQQQSRLRYFCTVCGQRAASSFAHCSSCDSEETCILSPLHSDRQEPDYWCEEYLSSMVYDDGDEPYMHNEYNLKSKGARTY